METEKFVNHLFAWYKTPDGQKWKETMTQRLMRCKSGSQQDNILRRALRKLEFEWERQKLLNGLGLVIDFTEKYGRSDENGQKFISFEALQNLMKIGGSIG
jgi:hypothetical protein